MRKFLKGFSFAFQGLMDSIKTQVNMRFHLFALCAVTAAGIFFQIDKVEWLIIILCFALVIGMELLNTAIEHLANAVTTEFNPLIKRAKDAAAAAVLWVSLLAALIGLWIFLPYIFD